MKIEIQRSKIGLPVITENGGGMTKTGSAQVICGKNGQKLKPLHIPRGYSNSDHALFVVRPGETFVLQAEVSRKGEFVILYKVLSILGEEAILHKVGEYKNGDGTIPQQFMLASKSVLEKANCYHCRDTHFVQED